MTLNYDDTAVPAHVEEDPQAYALVLIAESLRRLADEVGHFGRVVEGGVMYVMENRGET